MTQYQSAMDIYLNKVLIVVEWINLRDNRLSIKGMKEMRTYVNNMLTTL